MVESDATSFAVNQEESDLISTALKTNAFVAEAENEREARLHLLKGAKGGFWPTVSVVGLYQVLGKIQ